MTSARIWLLLLLTLAAAVVAARALTPEEARVRLQVLRAELSHHNELYFRQAAPEITDAAYDELKREQTRLEEAFPLLADRAAAEGSDDRTGIFPTYHHRERMLSLDKAYSEGELRAFQARLIRQVGAAAATCVVEPKYDGVAISVTYEKGELARAVTRGDGDVGDDVTVNVRAIPNLPQRLRAVDAEGSVNVIPDLIELRGEIYLPLAEFARINRERAAAGEAAYAHPRTLAAGALKQLDPGDVAERRLAVVFYGWGACVPARTQPASQQAFHRRVQQWGLPGVEQFWLARDAGEMWTAVQALQRDRGKLGFPVDGAVVKLDPVAGRRELGTTNHGPRWAMAYKYAPERVETRLRAITLQVGRSGVITPVAVFEPVKLGGATVTRATLYNREEIARRDVRVGDLVYVEKSGEVIPTLVGVDPARRNAGSRPFVFPTVCPDCRAALVQAENASAVRCPNYDCPAQLRRRLEHYASDAGVNIPGLGPATIEALVAHGIVKGIPDLYRLRREDLAAVFPGGGREKFTQRLLAAIARSLRAELWRFIHGLGIPHVGRVAAMELARRFGGLEALLQAGMSGEFAGQGGAGEVSAGVKGALTAYLAEPRNRAVITELIALGVRPVGR
jgi:DNA ligase (NAD+)